MTTTATSCPDEFCCDSTPRPTIEVHTTYTFLYDPNGRELIVRRPAGFGASVKMKPPSKMAPKFTPKKAAKKGCK
jgi:hypothetical protein